MSIPKPMYKESRKEFRLRLVLWIIENNSGLTYEDVVEQHNKIAKVRAAKESIVRDMKILAKRGQIVGAVAEEDGRMRYWYPAEV